jgi:hypothetical protein
VSATTDSIAAVEARLLDDPDDEAAWAVYGAWLLAQGDPRGELMLLEQIPANPAERAWLDELRRRAAGFAVFTQAAEWRHGCLVGATFRLSGRRDVRRLGELLADPRARLLGRLRLVFDAAMQPRVLAPLATAGVGRLRTLRAGYHARGNRVARALAEQETLHLRTLDLRHSSVTDDGLLALAGCPQLRGLRALHLQRNRFTAVGVAALVRSPALATLEHLDLRFNAVGAAGAAAIAESPHLGGVETLLVHADELEPAGVRALAASTSLRRDLVRFWRAREGLR